MILFFNNLYFSLSDISIGSYPYIKRLNNGNYIIISSTGIAIADSSLTTSNNVVTFLNPIYEEEKYIYSTFVEQFKSIDSGFIVAIIETKIYIFSPEGEYLSETNAPITSSEYPCSLIANNHEGVNFNFTVIYTTDSSGSSCEHCEYINFQKGIFNSNSKQITLQNVIAFNAKNKMNNQDVYASISCNIMKNNTEEYIVCLYGSSSLFCISVFDFDDYSEIEFKSNNVGGQYFNSKIYPDSREKGIFCRYISGNFIYCFNYNIKTNILDGEKQISTKYDECRAKYETLMMEYFYETEQFIIGCLGNSPHIYLTQANGELSYIKINEEISTGSYLNGRINIVLPSGATYYNLFGQNIKVNLNIEVEIFHEYPIEEEVSSTALICAKFYSYDQQECLEEVPKGFFCNSTTNKTIDKCHDNCETCDSGPNNGNNSCTTCIDNLFLNLGNCVNISKCINGYFNDNSIMKCKCTSNNACLLCDSSSSLCKGCNNETYYYPKKEDIDNNNIYINCYNNQTIGDSYFLNDNQQYQQCYSKCQKCTKLGDDISNNCTECKSGNSLMKNKNNIENCYPTCNTYFYFNNSNELVCLSNNKCPDGYKLINGEKRCVENCENDEVFKYKYEYEDICYQECPGYTKPLNNESFICKLINNK